MDGWTDGRVAFNDGTNKMAGGGIHALVLPLLPTLHGLMIPFWWLKKKLDISLTAIALNFKTLCEPTSLSQVGLYFWDGPITWLVDAAHHSLTLSCMRL